MPLLGVQRQIWFAEQFEQEPALYLMPFVFECAGPVRGADLEWAFATLVRRHAALRTVLHQRDGIVEQSFDGTPEYIHVPVANEDAATAAIRELTKPFQLFDGPLARGGCVSIGDSRHFLVFTFHHLIADGWSTDLFLREFRTLWHDPGSGAGQLPSIGLDLPAWIERSISGTARAVEDEHVEWWRQHLAAAPDAANLPWTRVTATQGTRRGRRYQLELDADLTARVRRAGAAYRVPVSTMLLAVMQLWLHRLSGDDEVVVGMPLVSRHDARALHTFGPLLNTVAIRSRISAATTFAGLLSETRESVFAAHAHADPRSIESSMLGRTGSSANPIFQTMFSFEQGAPVQPGRGRFVRCRAGLVKFRKPWHPEPRRSRLVFRVSGTCCPGSLRG